MSHEERLYAVEIIGEAVVAGARKVKACAVLGVTVRTVQRWEQSGGLNDKRQSAVKNPKNKLSEDEKDRIVEVCNLPENASCPPSQIVPALADDGVYLASESTFYRVLSERDQLNHRGRASEPRIVAKPMSCKATGPNQVWTWDITYLATTLKGVFFYLYMIVDIFSRKIVGWEIHESETSFHASVLFHKAYLSEGAAGKDIILHSDNGSPMKGATMLSMLQKLGAVPSFSRPSVSNDNPYSESLFRTMKYRPTFPSNPFDTVTEARQWVHTFVKWYNYEHKHSGLKFVTPHERHSGLDEAIFANRKEVYQEAKNRNPERWSGDIRNWDLPGFVLLNPEKKKENDKKIESLKVA